MSEQRRQLARDVLAAALAAAAPDTAVPRHLRRVGDQLFIHDDCYDLRHYRRLRVVGAGKASGAMAAAVEALLGDRLDAGLVIVKDGHAPPNPPGPSGACSIPRRTLRTKGGAGGADSGAPPSLRGRGARGGRSRVALREASHPIPDARGLAATAEMLALLGDLDADDLLLALLSGGGSALLEQPVAGVDLAALQATTELLLRAGAAIGEVNAVRKHLSSVKGGGLARLAAPATVLALVLSDVIGDPPDVIASGPLAPDPTTFADAGAVLTRHGLWQRVPPAVAARLQAGLAGQADETPKPGDPAFERVRQVVIGSNALAAEAAVERARALGLNALLLSTYVEGEAREVGRVLAALAREVAGRGRPVPRPACLVLGGETTVAVRGTGLGGRNQEVALGALPGVAGLDDVLILTAATDGGDGPTDAAGAWVDAGSLTRATALGLDPHAYLARNDAYHFFAALGDLLHTGPTLTNVNDLMFVYAF